MKCKFIIFLIALTSCTHTAKSQNNITLSVDVEKIPEMGFVISYLYHLYKNNKLINHPLPTLQWYIL